MASRTVGAIALRPTGNNQGGYFFFSLASGRVVNRNHWTTLPMPNDVIIRIHAMARRNPRGLTFSNRYRVPYMLDEDYADGDDDDSTYQAEEDDSNADESDNDDDNNNEPDDDYYNNDNRQEGGNNHNVEDIEILDEGEVELDLEVNDDVIPEDDENEEEDEEHFDVETDMDRRYGERNSEYNLRQRKARSYGHLHTQYSVNKGLKVFGAPGTEAVLQELVQLHDKQVVEPVHYHELSQAEKDQVLSYLMFLKEKRSGQMKGRGCADGRKQRSILTKEDSSSPTVSNEAVLLTSTIEAFLRRDIATLDIPGAFLHADMDGIVHIRIEGAMADLLLSLDPAKYSKFVVVRYGKNVIFLLLKKALYGTLKVSLLFWKLLSSLLISWGFVINPYDRCVANKTINGSQFMIIWHVDDLKLSHADPNEVTKIIDLLSKRFGTKSSPLTVTRGKIHDYLGMTLDFTEPGVAKIIMKPYIETILETLPDNMAGVSPTPAANHLFDVSPDSVLLPPKEQEFFHHVVAQLLFLCKRGRPDIQTAVAFLCTRVQHPTEEDYNKLTRVIKYLRGTIDIPLRLETESLETANWWIDASYAVHPDFKSHTGGIFSLGRGGIYNTSTRQKINAKSSTEAEPIGVADVLPQLLWTRYFLEAQGFTNMDTVAYQDNKSTILFCNNGTASSNKRTRHINVRYFFVTDRVTNKELRIAYCPTGDRFADFFTKALQGAQLIKFRDFILNIARGSSTLVRFEQRSVLDKNEQVSEEG